MLLAGHCLQRALALGPLMLVSYRRDGAGLVMELVGRGLQVAKALRRQGFSAESATALNAMTSSILIPWWFCGVLSGWRTSTTVSCPSEI